MAKIGLFYATDTGNTRKVAKMIKKQFDEDEVALHNVKEATAAENLAKYNALIFGTSCPLRASVHSSVSGTALRIHRVISAGRMPMRKI